MPLPVITDTIRAAAEGTNGRGVGWANVLHYRKDPALAYGAAITILDPLLLELYTNTAAGRMAWEVRAATTAQLSRLRYTPLDGVSASTVNTHVAVGTDAGQELPGNVALVASLHTALRGRSHRGRCYWGSFTENMNNAGGVPEPTYVAQIAAQWAWHLGRLVASGLTLVVASYSLATATNVTTVTVDGRWDSQRRRLGR